MRAETWEQGARGRREQCHSQGGLLTGCQEGQTSSPKIRGRNRDRIPLDSASPSNLYSHCNPDGEDNGCDSVLVAGTPARLLATAVGSVSSSFSLDISSPANPPARFPLLSAAIARVLT
ncbi:hypothetical protein K431DRAFT_81352 [Polychaeton citri CBS 116435]|uniref:Uncharacterized protein n=1 Tax=Polychaeton citri CBS 116435 TaxID=1314669 RepID=A0A9P4QE84_9PEZI|nr:hypothetical protein K431DRAFT_81352 [Polychaeton citri CBS 116435]